MWFEGWVRSVIGFIDGVKEVGELWARGGD